SKRDFARRAFAASRVRRVRGFENEHPLGLAPAAIPAAGRSAPAGPGISDDAERLGVPQYLYGVLLRNRIAAANSVAGRSPGIRRDLRNGKDPVREAVEPPEPIAPAAGRPG